MLLLVALAAARPSFAAHELRPSGEERVLPDRFLGYDYKVYRTNYVHDAVWMQAVQELQPGLLRYPGGNHANFWDWREGKPNDVLIGQRPRGTTFERHTLDDHQALLRASGTEPVWSANILTSTLDEQLAWLREIQARGLPVRRVELGNELFFNEATHREVFQNGRVYGRVATEWIRAIKREFPGARCGVPLWAPLHARKSYRLTHWNGQVMEKLRGADAAILHVYVNSGLPDAASLSDTGRVAEALARPRLAMDRLRADTSLPKDLPWWITEFNMIDSDRPTMRGGLPGLFVAHLLAEFLAEPRVELALLYQLTESSGLAALHGRAIEYAGYPGQPPELGARTAAGEVMRLFSDTLQGGHRVQTLATTDVPIASAETEGRRVDYPSLRGFVVRSPEGQTQILLVNLSADPVDVDASQFDPTAADILILKPDRPVLRRGDAERKTAAVEAVFTVPGYAVVRLRGSAP